MTTCEFCDIVDADDRAFVIYEDERTLAFLDQSPASRGHTLIVPRRHAATLLDIEPADAGAVMIAAVHVTHLLQDALQPNGFTLLQANEIAGWQSIFHVHLHVIPRWDENELESPWWPQKADLDELRDVAAAVRDAGSVVSRQAGTGDRGASSDGDESWALDPVTQDPKVDRSVEATIARTGGR